VADEYYPGKYLAEITAKCRDLTINEMLRNVEETMRNNRLGFGHYLFDGAHAPKDTWSIPGALDFDVVNKEGGVELSFKVGPFAREELTVHVEEGHLDVEAVHEEQGAEGGPTRRVRVYKHVPVHYEFDLDDVEARFEDKALVVKIPRRTKPRRKVEIL
jgi:HSP20 family molecular chaperone IbpA